MIVVDASLAAKWILWEDQSAEALHFLKAFQSELCAPDLILVEVAGAVTRIARMANIADDDSERLLTWWFGDFGLAAVDLRRPSRDIVREAARISIALSHPIQDCLYLAMAADLDADLVTCDGKFHRKAVDTYPRVKLLSDYRRMSSR